MTTYDSRQRIQPPQRAESDKRTRVCHIVILPDLAGSQRMMFDLCRRLDPDRYDRHVICQGEGVLTDALREAGIQYHLVPSLGRPIHPVRDWLAVRHIAAICREHQFDVVHTHNSKGGILGRVGARRADTPSIVHCVQGFAFHEFSGFLKRLLYSRVESIAGRYCDRVIFVNDEEREMSVRNGWLPEEKCVTIYNGVDVALFDPRQNVAAREELRRGLGMIDDEIGILISGRLEPQKQPLILPEIAAEIEQLRPANKWRFVIAGSGTLEPRLREGFARRQLLHRYCPIGWHPQPHKVNGACDLALLPSLWEGLPLSLIEAQASGLPIVASNVKGNREVVTEQTGFLCEPKTPVEYASPLARLVDDAELRQQLGTAARRRATAEFSAEKCFQQVVDLYDELSRKRPDAVAGRRRAA